MNSESSFYSATASHVLSHTFPLSSMAIVTTEIAHHVPIGRHTGSTMNSMTLSGTAQTIASIFATTVPPRRVELGARQTTPLIITSASVNSQLHSATTSSSSTSWW